MSSNSKTRRSSSTRQAWRVGSCLEKRLDKNTNFSWKEVFISPTSSRVNPTMQQAIQQLVQWADSRGMRIVTGDPLNDETINIFPQLIAPFFGGFSFVVPPSYREFLLAMSSLQIQANHHTEGDPAGVEFHVLPRFIHLTLLSMPGNSSSFPIRSPR